MGDLHLSGKGVTEDFAEALKCYQQGAELGIICTHTFTLMHITCVTQASQLAATLRNIIRQRALETS